MLKTVQNVEEIVAEILRMHRSLPPRPSLDEIEAAVALIQNVENTMSARLQMVSKQPKPPDVPDELFAVLQEMHKSLICMQSEEDKRQALTLLELEERHRSFDDLLQKASGALSGHESISMVIHRNHLIDDGSFVVQKAIAVAHEVNTNGGGFYCKRNNVVGSAPEYSVDDCFIQKPKATFGYGVTARSEADLGLCHLEKWSSNYKIKSEYDDNNGEKLSLIKLKGVIGTSAKKGCENLDLRGKLIDQLYWIPDSIGMLSSLTQLDLSENKIVSLPASIEGLSGLKILDLHTNQLQSLPDTIGKLGILNSLDLHGNRLTTLPGSLGDLKSLTCLDVSSNQLSSLPLSVGQLSNLERLNIETNEIGELPYTIGQCAALTKLRADFNHLKGLPEAIGKLESLQVLTLHYNKIKSLPTSMASLSNLKELDLNFNQLECIPESLCFVTSLIKLNVGSNFADLQRLPRSIGNLEMLDELDISNNQIKVLPDSFSLLSKLRILHAEETPLEMPPTDIAGKGAQAVVRFMMEYVAKRDEKLKGTKNKAMYSKLWACSTNHHESSAW
eukprot:Gb_12684 [translate_table: standard]